MELDAESLPDGQTLEADLCIVGAGPAGLTLAHEWAGGAASAIVLAGDGAGAQALAVGDGTGDRYQPLERTRCRALGGTARLWNTPWRGADAAKYVGLDAIDLQARPALGLPGWPFEREALDAVYRRAQRICGLGDAAPDAAASLGDVAPLVASHYRIGPASVFTALLPGRIAADPRITLVHHASATALLAERAPERLDAIEARTLSGRRLSIRARCFVLAAGAIENARLLLLPTRWDARGTGNGSGLVGRGFMEHPRDYSMIVRPASAEAYARAAFCDLHDQGARGATMGRFGLAAERLQREGLLNASITMFPLLVPWSRRWRAALSRGAFGRVNRRAGRPGDETQVVADYPRAPQGWSARLHDTRRFAGLRLLVNLEQAPHADNRVTLSARRDRFGAPLAALHWRWHASDRRNLLRWREWLTRELSRAGWGRVETRGALAPDPNAHHHAGTTRMHRDPDLGVVDEHGRVHRVENLYLAGASVFPSAGFANPTLTIVALALRLAGHLRARL